MAENQMAEKKKEEEEEEERAIVLGPAASCCINGQRGEWTDTYPRPPRLQLPGRQPRGEQSGPRARSFNVSHAHSFHE